MLPDICIQIGENAAKGASGNPTFGGGLLGAGIIGADGISYSGKLASGGCVGKPVLSAMAQAPTKFTIGLFSDQETPVDLTNTSRVVFIAREMTYVDFKYIEKDCTIENPPTEGVITLELTVDDTEYAGLWEAGFQLLNASDELQAEFRVYLELQKSMNYTHSSKNDPITIGEVRMALYDKCPADNEFLDDVEFTDSEIIYAIRRIVDLWNEEKPVIAGAIYTMATFPYRYHGVNAACGELMKMKGIQLMRNRLPFSTGGGKIDDKQRANPYIQIGSELIQDYRNWMRTEKARINANNVYGGTGRSRMPIYGTPGNTR